MKIAVQKIHLAGQILYRSLDPIKKQCPYKEKTIFSENKKGTIMAKVEKEVQCYLDLS